MNRKSLIFAGALLLVLAMLAGHPDQSQARDRIFVGADLGGVSVHFDNYPRRVWGPPPPPPPPRFWGWGPPPPPPPSSYWGWRHYPPPPPPPPRRWHRHHHHYRYW